jgi:cytochrome c oxidase subunit 3
MAEPHYELPTTGNRHPYHLVDPSPWPLLSAFAAGFMFLGVAMNMHKAAFGHEIMIAGILSLLTCMFLWWKDVVKEAVKLKLHSPVVKIGFRYGMVLFIASEVMFFFAFFWAYFSASLFPTAAIGHVWPPANIETVDPLDLPLMMTLILLLSGCTVTWAHHALLENKISEAVKALAITVGLGIFFTGFQLYEYHHVTFGFKDGIFPSTFFMATGFHGFHVIIGTILLLVTLIRTKKCHFTSESHFGFEAAAWYWHFVDVVWLFLFVAIYWWGAK